MTGYVVEKNVVKGSAFEPGARLYRIAPLSRVWVEAEVYEFELSSVRTGQRATVRLPYLPDRSFDRNARAIASEMGTGPDGISNLLELHSADFDVDRIDREIRKKWEQQTRIQLPSNTALRDEIRTLARMVRMTRKFADGIQDLGKLSRLDLADDDFAAKAQQLQENIADAFGLWVHIDLVSVIWDPDIPLRNLALVKALADITGQPEPLVGVVSEFRKDGSTVDRLTA